MTSEDKFWAIFAGIAVAYFVLSIIYYVIRYRFQRGGEHFSGFLFEKAFYSGEFTTGVTLIYTFFRPEYSHIVSDTKPFLMLAGLLCSAHSTVGFIRGREP